MHLYKHDLYKMKREQRCGKQIDIQCSNSQKPAETLEPSLKQSAMSFIEEVEKLEDDDQKLYVQTFCLYRETKVCIRG